MMNPNVINFPGCVSSDAVARAQLYMSKLEVPIGSYSDCRGFSFCRKKISQYINKRDKVEDSSHEQIYFTNGTGEGINLIYTMLMRSKNDAVLIPVPYYPLYSVLATLHNGTAVPYFLDENANWSINPK